MTDPVGKKDQSDSLKDRSFHTKTTITKPFLASKYKCFIDIDDHNKNNIFSGQILVI